MDRLESMSVFVAVADAGSLSAAGRRLGVPLPTISRKVSELETHLGIQLVRRSSRRIALTDAGAAYLDACKRILEQIGEAERAASGEYQTPRGELIITAPIVFGRLHILPIVCEFLKAYPDIDIRLLLSDHNISLLDEHIHVAVRIGRLPDSSLMGTPIGTVRQIICGSPAYFAARGMPTTPEELGAHDCITVDVVGVPHSWRFQGGKLERAVTIHSRLFVSTAEAAVDAAVSAIGITRLLSYQAASAVADKTLVIILEDFELPPQPINLLHAGGKLAPLKLRAFLDFTAPRLKARLQQ